MQPNPQFVESLIALRSHYQSLYDQAERYVSDVRHQLTDHANTLLFDQNVEDQALVKSLIAMRQQWRELSEDCSSQIDHAREQLTHVNALLADQMVMQIPSLPVSMEALTVNENKILGLTGTPEIKNDESPKEPDERGIRINRTNPETTPLLVSETLTPMRVRPIYNDNVVEGAPHSLALDEAGENLVKLGQPLNNPLVRKRDINADEGCPSFTGLFATASDPVPIVTVQSEPELNISLDDEPKDQPELPTALTTVAPLVQPNSITKSDASTKNQADSKQLLPLTVPPNLQAVENLLSQKAGAILHRDYLLRVLCGELEPDDLEVETATLSEILTIGVNQGLWAEVPDEKDCYTLDLRLVDPELAAKASKQKQSGEPPKSLPRRKLALKPLLSYQHLSLTDAIERVLMENAPQTLNIDTVTQKLFGSIESMARKSVGDLLVKGVIKGRWQRVPGRGAARYNISLKSKSVTRN